MTIFKETRLKLNVTQEKMAQVLDIPLRRYRSYEHGERMPDYESVAKILYIRNKGRDRELAKILKQLIKEGWYDKDFIKGQL